MWCRVKRHNSLVKDGRIIAKDFAVAVGRFNANGPEGYKAATMPDAPLRATRAEAMEDERLYLTRVLL